MVAHSVFTTFGKRSFEACFLTERLKVDVGDTRSRIVLNYFQRASREVDVKPLEGRHQNELCRRMFFERAVVHVSFCHTDIQQSL